MKLLRIVGALSVVLVLTSSAQAVDVRSSHYISTDFDWLGFYDGIGLARDDMPVTGAATDSSYPEVIAAFSIRRGIAL